MSHRAAVPGSSGVLSASAVMAAGTVVSRITGFGRAILILAALGSALNAEVFTLSNTLPNALYILVAGGIFNVVLVPQLIRAMLHDKDGGDAYANRVVTLGLLVLAAATVVLVLLTPLLVRLIFSAAIYDPSNAGALDSAYALMRYCMPQVFFYGAFVLVGQILNARGRFGPMMWAPIVNNVVSCGVLGLYIVLYGTTNGANGFSTQQELLLGLGSTLGIALQTAVLVPYLRSAGFSYRPRFDFRGVGLGHTLRLGLWTFWFIIVNQVAFVVVNRIGSGSATEAKATGGQSAGATIYQFAFLISQVPHGIITVSVVTATMPLLSRLAADNLRDDVRGELTRSLRIVLSAIVPIAVAIACLGQPLASLVTTNDQLSAETDLIGYTIMAFAPGMVFFSVHYLMLRGFYAMEDTRTPFLIQVWLSASNIVLAVVLTASVRSGLVSTMLALAYGGAYLIGSTISTTVLSRRVGPILGADTRRFLVRLGAACLVAAAVMVGVTLGLAALDVHVRDRLDAAIVLVSAGLLGAASYLLAARLLRVTEVSALVRALTRRGH